MIAYYTTSPGPEAMAETIATTSRFRGVQEYPGSFEIDYHAPALKNVISDETGEGSAIGRKVAQVLNHKAPFAEGQALHRKVSEHDHARSGFRRFPVL